MQFGVETDLIESPLLATYSSMAKPQQRGAQRKNRKFLFHRAKPNI